MYHDTGILLSAADIYDPPVHAAITIAPGPGGSAMVPFPHAHCDVLHARLLGEYCRCMLVGLWPSQQIVAHCDASIAPARRYHLPIQTNEGCWSFHDGVWQHLEMGRLYEMDPTLLHGAVNWGSEIRLHLMIDVVR